MRRALAVSSLLALAGCASLFNAIIAPASAPVASTAREAIWSASFAELQARGFAIAAQDPASGAIRTETMVMPGSVPCGFVECAYRDTVHVTVAPQGDVGVRIARELSTFWVASIPGALIGGTRWRPPAFTQQSTVAGVVADQDELLRAILARAGVALPPWPSSAAAGAPDPVVALPPWPSSAAAGAPDPVEAPTSNTPPTPSGP